MSIINRLCGPDTRRRRMQLLDEKGVPVQSEVRQQLGGPLAEVFFPTLDEPCKHLMGLTPPLTGPQPPLWVSPSDTLLGCLKLKPPLTTRLLRATTHNLIIDLGNDIVRKFQNELRGEVLSAIYEVQKHMKWNCADDIRKVEEATRKAEQKICEESKDALIKKIARDLENQQGIKQKNMEDNMAITIQKERKEVQELMDDKLKFALRVKDAEDRRKCRVAIARALENQAKEYQKLLDEMRGQLLDTIAGALRELDAEKERLKHQLETEARADVAEAVTAERRRAKEAMEERKRRDEALKKAGLLDDAPVKPCAPSALLQRADRLEQEANAAERLLNHVLEEFHRFASFVQQSLPASGPAMLTLDRVHALEELLKEEEVKTPEESSSTTEASSTESSTDEVPCPFKTGRKSPAERTSKTGRLSKTGRPSKDGKAKARDSKAEKPKDSKEPKPWGHTTEEMIPKRPKELPTGRPSGVQSPGELSPKERASVRPDGKPEVEGKRSSKAIKHGRKRSPRRTRDIPWVEPLHSPPSEKQERADTSGAARESMLRCHSLTSVQRLVLGTVQEAEAAMEAEDGMGPEDAEPPESGMKLALAAVGAVIPGMGASVAAAMKPDGPAAQLANLLRIPSGRDRRGEKYYDGPSTTSESEREEDKDSSLSGVDGKDKLPEGVGKPDGGVETLFDSDYEKEAEILLEEMEAAKRGEKAFDPDWRKRVREEKGQSEGKWDPRSKPYEEWKGKEGVCVCAPSDVGEPQDEAESALHPKLPGKMPHFGDETSGPRRESGGIDYTHDELDSDKGRYPGGRRKRDGKTDEQGRPIHPEKQKLKGDGRFYRKSKTGSRDKGDDFSYQDDSGRKPGEREKFYLDDGGDVYHDGGKDFDYFEEVGGADGSGRRKKRRDKRGKKRRRSRGGKLSSLDDEFDLQEEGRDGRPGVGGEKRKGRPGEKRRRGHPEDDDEYSDDMSDSDSQDGSSQGGSSDESERRRTGRPGERESPDRAGERGADRQDGRGSPTYSEKEREYGSSEDGVSQGGRRKRHRPGEPGRKADGEIGSADDLRAIGAPDERGRPGGIDERGRLIGEDGKVKGERDSMDKEDRELDGKKGRKEKYPDDREGLESGDQIHLEGDFPGVLEDLQGGTDKPDYQQLGGPGFPEELDKRYVPCVCTSDDKLSKKGEPQPIPDAIYDDEETPQFSEFLVDRDDREPRDQDLTEGRRLHTYDYSGQPGYPGEPGPGKPPYSPISSQDRKEAPKEKIGGPTETLTSTMGEQPSWILDEKAEQSEYGTQEDIVRQEIETIDGESIVKPLDPNELIAPMYPYDREFPCNIECDAVCGPKVSEFVIPEFPGRDGTERPDFFLRKKPGDRSVPYPSGFPPELRDDDVNLGERQEFYEPRHPGFDPAREGKQSIPAEYKVHRPPIQGARHPGSPRGRCRTRQFDIDVVPSSIMRAPDGTVVTDDLLFPPEICPELFRDDVCPAFRRKVPGALQQEDGFDRKQLQYDEMDKGTSSKQKGHRDGVEFGHPSDGRGRDLGLSRRDFPDKSGGVRYPGDTTRRGYPPQSDGRGFPGDADKYAYAGDRSDRGYLQGQGRTGFPDDNGDLKYPDRYAGRPGDQGYPDGSGKYGPGGQKGRYGLQYHDGKKRDMLDDDGWDRERFPDRMQQDMMLDRDGRGYPLGRDGDGYPDGRGEGRYPAGPDRGDGRDGYPSGRGTDGYPVGDDRGGYPPGRDGDQRGRGRDGQGLGRDRDGFPAGRGKDGYGPGGRGEGYPFDRDDRDIDGYTPGGDRDGYPPGGGRDGYPPGGGRDGYPPGGGRDGYPPGGGRDGYPPGSGRDGYPPGGGRDGYPAGRGRDGYPPGGGRDGHPPGGGRDGYPPGGGRDGYPPGGGRDGYPPGGRDGYPPGGGRDGYPPGDGRGGYPPGGGKDGYPPGGGRDGYPPGGGRDGYPPGGRDGYPPGGGRDGYPPGDGRDGYPPGGGKDGYPPGGGRDGYPPGGGRDGYPPGGGRDGYPAGRGRDGYPPGGGRDGHPPGGGRDGYPPGGGRDGYPAGRGRDGYPPGGGRDGYPPGGGRDGYPPGGRDGYPPGGGKDGYPPGGGRDGYPPGGGRDGYPPGGRDGYPPGGGKDGYPPGGGRDGYPPGSGRDGYPPGGGRDGYPPGGGRDGYPPGGGRDGYPPGRGGDEYPYGRDGEGYPPGYDRDQQFPQDGTGAGGGRGQFPGDQGAQYQSGLGGEPYMGSETPHGEKILTGQTKPYGPGSAGYPYGVIEPDTSESSEYRSKRGEVMHEVPSEYASGMDGKVRPQSISSDDVYIPKWPGVGDSVPDDSTSSVLDPRWEGEEWARPITLPGAPIPGQKVLPHEARKGPTWGAREQGQAPSDDQYQGIGPHWTADGQGPSGPILKGVQPQRPQKGPAFPDSISSGGLQFEVTDPPVIYAGGDQAYPGYPPGYPGPEGQAQFGLMRPSGATDPSQKGFGIPQEFMRESGTGEAGSQIDPFASQMRPSGPGVGPTAQQTGVPSGMASKMRPSGFPSMVRASGVQPPGSPETPEAFGAPGYARPGMQVPDPYSTPSVVPYEPAGAGYPSAGYPSAGYPTGAYPEYGRKKGTGPGSFVVPGTPGIPPSGFPTDHGRHGAMSGSFLGKTPQVGTPHIPPSGFPQGSGICRGLSTQPDVCTVIGKRKRIYPGLKRAATSVSAVAAGLPTAPLGPHPHVAATLSPRDTLRCRRADLCAIDRLLARGAIDSPEEYWDLLLKSGSDTSARVGPRMSVATLSEQELLGLLDPCGHRLPREKAQKKTKAPAKPTKKDDRPVCPYAERLDRLKGSKRIGESLAQVLLQRMAKQTTPKEVCADESKEDSKRKKEKEGKGKKPSQLAAKPESLSEEGEANARVLDILRKLSRHPSLSRMFVGANA